MLAAQEGEGRSSSAVRLAGRWRLLDGFSVLQNVKNGSLGAWYVMHDPTPGRYHVEIKQNGPNAHSFAKISSGFNSSARGPGSYFEVPADVRGDKHGP